MSQTPMLVAASPYSVMEFSQNPPTLSEGNRINLLPYEFKQILLSRSLNVPSFK